MCMEEDAIQAESKISTKVPLLQLEKGRQLAFGRTSQT
jgi:hypothetical protein